MQSCTNMWYFKIFRIAGTGTTMKTWDKKIRLSNIAVITWLRGCSFWNYKVILRYLKSPGQFWSYFNMLKIVGWALYVVKIWHKMMHFFTFQSNFEIFFLKGSAYCTKPVLCNSSLMHKTLPFCSLSFLSVSRENNALAVLIST